MLIAVVVLQTMLLVAVLWAVLRRSGGGTASATDARLAGIHDLLTRMDARADGLDGHLRGTLEGMRRDLAAEAQANRDTSASAAAALRTEVLGCVTSLGAGLNAALEGFRTDNKGSAEALRTAVQGSLDTIAQRLSAAMADSARNEREAREALHLRLREVTESNAAQQDKLRGAVEDRLNQINQTNAAKLEEMRLTVDEKLHATLHTRLTESFGQVTDQLNKVHTGLGEMSKLSEGVDGLSRIFTNVKSRGGFAEVQLGMLLKQMLAPGQFIENAAVKPGSLERVEYAVRFPTNAGERLMPIDAKFPREVWERLEAAYESNATDVISREGKAFESAIRAQAEKICSKYINPPVTTPYAIMFLPTEGLYAEVIRREALQAEIQSRCHVTIAGPTTLSAILTSFQMGFHMLALQEKGDEVWKVLDAAKREFGKFEALMDKMENDVGKIQKSFGEVGVRTRAINRTLREVSTGSGDTNGVLEFEGLASPSLALAAAAEDR